MDISAALGYIKPEHKQQFNLHLENYLAKKDKTAEQRIEELCFKLMQTYPQCVYEPIVKTYVILKNG